MSAEAPAGVTRQGGGNMAAEVKSDIEIARAAKKQPIWEIGAKLGIPAEHLEPYGNDKAKVSAEFIRSLADRPDGKLVLVTAISPTPAGEGKTTTTVGLGDGLNRIGKRAAVCLREPSLGPCFGMKGGAAGGGYAQVVPMEDINLHFTGDFHAITAAHNLLAALIDNHIYWGNVRKPRRAPHLLAARHGHERPGAARDRLLARRRRQRLSARGRLRHHRRLRDHGDPLPRQRHRRPAAADRRHRHRLPPRQERRDGARHQGRRGDDGALDEGDPAEPRADAGEQPRLHPWRALRQHRAWLQFGDGDQDGAETRRLRRHGSGFRRRSRRGKVLRHQMPLGRAEAVGRRHRRDHPGAEDAWRGRQGLAWASPTSRRYAKAAPISDATSTM